MRRLPTRHEKNSLDRALFLAALSTRAALQLGDSYEKVITEKGRPAGKMEAGAIQILNYTDLSVRFKDGLVAGMTVPHPRISEVHPTVPQSYAPAGAVT